MFDFAALLPYVNPATYGINLLDIIIVVIFLFYAYEGYKLGFVFAASDLISFVFSFIIALKFYPDVSHGIVALFGIPIGFANAAAFFLLAFVSEILFGLVFRYLLRFVPKMPTTTLVGKIGTSIDHWFGFVPGVLSAFIILSFLLSLIVSLPSSPLVKQLVTNSRVGEQLVANTSFFESRLNDIFGGALSETLNFVTVKPDSHETVQLKFIVADGTVDELAEKEMLVLVNQERERAGLAPVVFDKKLTKVARAHSQDMFKRGYFSHYTPEGISPFERMDTEEIVYGYAGENLALAPSTNLAMQGLMNSPGHRANILDPDFTKLGIGVIDGGIYGKMYSQEFTD